jgi:hypothetical protein
MRLISIEPWARRVTPWAIGLPVALAAAGVAAGERSSVETKIHVRPEVGKRFTPFEARWRTPVRIGRHDQLQYDLWGPGYVSEPGNRGCHGRLRVTTFPSTLAEAGEAPVRRGGLVRKTDWIAELQGAEERGWCPGRYRGWVRVRKPKRSRRCPPDTARDGCWRRIYVGSYQYTVKAKDDRWQPPIPVPRDPLLEYFSNGSPTFVPRGVSDVLWVTRTGVALVRLYNARGNPWRAACLGRRRLSELEALVSAQRLGARVTRPYPRRGWQALSFGRDGRRLIQARPAPWAGPMRGRLRRRLFRTVDGIRVDARRSHRHTKCVGARGGDENG